MLLAQLLINGLQTGALYALVALIWLVPDRRIEHALRAESTPP